MEEIYRAVGVNIRAQRLRLGLTLEDLADLASLPAPYIGQIERGTKQASLRSVAALARGLGVPVARLFSAASGRKNASASTRVEALLRANTGAERALLVSMVRHLSKGLRRL
jgi:transcriptional regulator with XRE-family HTH domain